MVELRSTSPYLTCQKNRRRGFLLLVYDDSEWLDNCLQRKLTTYFTLVSFSPWALLSYSRWMNLLMTTPAPSWGPFPWPFPKKGHIILHPLVILRYSLTKYQGFVLLNYATQPFNHTKCHFSAYLCSTMCCQWSLKQCCTNF
jgi:hypothetical protein